MSESLKQRKLVLNLIWGALCLAVVTFGVIHVMLGKAGQGPESTKLIGYILVFLAVTESFLGWAWHRWTVGRIGDAVTPTAIQRLGPAERQKKQEALQGTAIICLAFFEAIAVYGLVASLLGVPIPYLFETLAGLSLLMLVLYRIQGFHEIFGLLEKLDMRNGV